VTVELRLQGSVEVPRDTLEYVIGNITESLAGLLEVAVENIVNVTLVQVDQTRKKRQENIFRFNTVRFSLRAEGAQDSVQQLQQRVSLETKCWQVCQLCGESGKSYAWQILTITSQVSSLVWLPACWKHCDLMAESCQQSFHKRIATYCISCNVLYSSILHSHLRLPRAQ